MGDDDNLGDRRAGPAQQVRGSRGTSLRWRRSSRSTNTSNCVEVLFARTAVDIRDSKNPAGPTLAFPEMAWLAFLGDHIGPGSRHGSSSTLGNHMHP